MQTLIGHKLLDALWDENIILHHDDMIIEWQWAVVSKKIFRSEAIGLLLKLVTYIIDSNRMKRVCPFGRQGGDWINWPSLS